MPASDIHYVNSKVLEEAKALHKITAPDYNNIRARYQVKPEEIKQNLFVKQNKICDNILDLIGSSPMVRLSRFAELHGIECELLGKCDFMSAGGSVKDRAVKQIIEDLEKEGSIKPGDTLIEATSGNTGVALALISAIKGYHSIITLPEKMSQEKLDLVVGLGAEVVRTPTEAAWNDPESNITLAKRLSHLIPNSCFVDQYSRPANPKSHYLTTANEIIEQCDGRIDVLVMTSGTGGTISGTAKRIKEVIPTCQVVAVDPYGSILAQPKELNLRSGETYLVEGIGYDFVPSTLDYSVIDKWVKVDDEVSLKTARELIRYEGILAGGSAGSAMAGALSVARTMKKGQRLVVLFPDSIRNYMTKFLNKDYMIYHGFEPVPKTPSPFGDKTVKDLILSSTPTLCELVSCLEAVTVMSTFKLDHIPMTKEEEGTITGVLSLQTVNKGLLSGQSSETTPVKKYVVRRFKSVTYDTPLINIAYYLNVSPYCLLFDERNSFVSMITLTNLYCSGTMQ